MVKKRLIARIIVYSVLFLMYLPILVLIAFSFTTADSIGNWTGFSFDLYIALFKNKDIMRALLNTVTIALTSAIVSTILGTLGAIGIFYSKKRVKNTLESISQIPVMNAEIVIALSLTLLFVFTRDKLNIPVEFGFVTLLIGHVVLTIPFVVLSIKPKLIQMDPNIYEAALDLGATPKTALAKVVFPEIVPGILTGFLLSITLSLDDYIITKFTGSETFDTLSTYIYGSTAKKGAVPAPLRALTTIIFVVVLLVLVIVNHSAKNKVKSRRGKKNA